MPNVAKELDQEVKKEAGTSGSDTGSNEEQKEVVDGPGGEASDAEESNQIRNGASGSDSDNGGASHRDDEMLTFTDTFQDAGVGPFLIHFDIEGATTKENRNFGQRLARWFFTYNGESDIAVPHATFNGNRGEFTSRNLSEIGVLSPFNPRAATSFPLDEGDVNERCTGLLKKIQGNMAYELWHANTFTAANQASLVATLQQRCKDRGLTDVKLKAMISGRGLIGPKTFALVRMEWKLSV